MRALISSKIFCRNGARWSVDLLGVGVLRLEVVDDLGIGLVAQPLVGVDEDVAVMLAAVLDPLGDRGTGVIGHASGPIQSANCRPEMRS